MSQREAARHFGISRDTVRKMLAYSVPPGYRRQAPVRRPKLDAFTAIIDRWLDEDRTVPRKQRHTAKRGLTGCVMNMDFPAATRSSRTTCTSGRGAVRKYLCRWPILPGMARRTLGRL